jgi:hypothetical protein|nr:MAG TPA: protein of unknown function (UPF0154) [Caudoviricetes sp.]
MVVLTIQNFLCVIGIGLSIGMIGGFFLVCWLTKS